MENWIAYHSTRVMGRSYSPRTSFVFHTSKPERTLRRALGKRAWVIVGTPTSNGTQYSLVGAYQPRDLESDGDAWIVTGTGVPFDPPFDVTGSSWFEELRDEQANFSLGFSQIRSENVILQLEALVSSQLTPAEFWDDETQDYHQEFQDWRREYPDGHLLSFTNRRRALLHRSPCWHLGAFDWNPEDASLTRSRKVCAPSAPALHEWARAQAIAVAPCTHCSPDLAGFMASVSTPRGQPPLELMPTADPREYEDRAEQLLARGQVTRPVGVAQPVPILGSALGFRRDPAVRAWVLQRADGNCELCRTPAPFHTQSGRPYLESHHALTLANGGPDTPDNTAAICPNCHRRLHFGSDRAALSEELITRIRDAEAAHQ